MVVRAGRAREWTSGLGVALLCVFIGQVARAVPAAPVLYSPVVAGPQVTLNWSAVTGALGYRLSVGLTPTTEGFAQLVGPVTSVSFTSPFVGSAYVRVQAVDASGLSAPSNNVVLTVTSLTPVPAAPINLQASISGTTVHLSWAAGSGGGAPLGVLLEAGTASGAANLGAVPLPLSTSVSVPAVSPGTYFVRVYGFNGSGRSLPSNEVRVDMSGGGGCTTPGAPSLATAVSGSTVSFSWAPVAGVAGFRLEVATIPGGPAVVAESYGPSVTTRSFPNAPAGTYYARLYAISACGAWSTSGERSLTVAPPPPPPPGSGPRTPNPPPGQILPLPDMSSVVEAVARAYPADLRNSCGNHTWLFRLVQELRRYDTRWGLNWKRGRVGDMSEDIVDYNYSADPDEGTTQVYIIDVIGGHCGSNPSPSWIDQTEATRVNGTIGRWTLQPYVAAGGTP